MIKEIYLDIDDTLNKFFEGLMKFYHLSTDYASWSDIGSYNIRGHVNSKRRHPLSVQAFWSALPEDFWFDLEKSDMCDELIDRCFDMVGPHNTYVATSPTKCSDSFAAKHRWIVANLPESFHRNFFITPRKYKLGKPGALLIDDHSDNCRLFAAEGGLGITVPRPWNEMSKLSHRSMQYVFETLEALTVGT